MAVYRYLLADVLSGSLLAEVPFESATYGHVLNAPGAFSGTLGLKQPTSLQNVLSSSLNYGKVALYVERDGVIVWGGMLWGDAPDFDAGTLEIRGEGWHSYFRRRVLRATKTYVQQDQTTQIAKDLIDWAQGVVGGSVGVDTSSVLATGVLRDRTYNAYERKNIGEAIEQLAAVDGGFDFRYDSAWNGSSILTRFLTSFPATGRQTNIVFEGQLSSLKVTRDATFLATTVDAMGAGEGDARLISTVSDPSLIGVYPLLDDVVSNTDVSIRATLDGYARQRLTRGRSPIVIPSIDVDPSRDPVIGSYVPGDIVTVRGGYGLVTINGQFRITSYSVKVDDSGGEVASLSFAGLESYT
jgi:hypothetical protein